MTAKPIINIDDLKLDEQHHGKQFAVKYGRAGPTLGLNALGCALHVVPPGKRAFPFHAHHATDELFFILSGSGEYRLGDATHPVRAGDMIGAPAGATAHQLVNIGTEPLRYLGISTTVGTDVVEYPDSGKFAVAAGIKNADFRTATFKYIGREGEMLDYWAGEPD